jgi:hypothetical protein
MPNSTEFYGFTSEKITMKSTIYWNVMPCSKLVIQQHFGRTYAKFYRILWLHFREDNNEKYYLLGCYAM